MFTFSPSFATRVVQGPPRRINTRARSKGLHYKGLLVKTYPLHEAKILSKNGGRHVFAQYDAAERRQEASYWSIVRYTSPNKLQKLLIGQLALELPAQAPPELHPVAHSKPYHLSALLKPPSSIYAASRAEEPGKLAIFPPSSETWVRLHFAFARLTPELRLARQPKANKPKIVFVPTGRRLSAISSASSQRRRTSCLPLNFILPSPRLTPELRLARQPKANRPKIVFVPTGRRLSAIVRRQSNDGGPPCLTSLAS
jgi:hypothetical protein